MAKSADKINFAAASCGVSEELELFLVQLLVLCLSSLILDVLLDHALRALLPNRPHEVALRPQLPAPQLLLDFRATAEDFSRRDALNQLHHPLRAVEWH